MSIDWGKLAQTIVWGIIVGVPAWKLYQWGRQPVSSSALRVAAIVEQEQEQIRAMVASAPQWHPGVTTSMDVHDYGDLDDVPQDIVLEHKRRHIA
jgi:hypothetical protein